MLLCEALRSAALGRRAAPRTVEAANSGSHAKKRFTSRQFSGRGHAIHVHDVVRSTPPGSDIPPTALPHLHLLMQRISSQDVVDLLLDAVCIVKADSEIVFVSPAFERIFGYAPHEAVGLRMLDLVHPDDVAVTRAQASHVTAGTEQLHFENRYVRKDGATAYIRWTARWLPDRQLRLAVAHDISDRKRAEAVQAAVYAIAEAGHASSNAESLLQRVHQIVSTVLPAAGLTLAEADHDTGALRFRHAPVAGTEPGGLGQPLGGRGPDPLYAEVMRRREPLRLGPDNGAHAVLSQAQPPTPSSTLLPLPPQPGQPSHWLGVPLQMPDGVPGALAIYSDDTRQVFSDTDLTSLQSMANELASALERQQLVARLQYMAQYDQLTQLPNRQLFMDRLQTALMRAKRSQTVVSLLFIDLDGFKEVNDSLGHAVGDRLLQRVAQRLLQGVRESDTVARLGGDEFVVLLENLPARDPALAAADKVLGAFSQPFNLEGRHLEVKPSIGIALYPDHADDAHRLLGRADAAMYLAKKNGGNQTLMSPGSAMSAMSEVLPSSPGSPGSPGSPKG